MAAGLRSTARPRRVQVDTRAVERPNRMTCQRTCNDERHPMSFISTASYGRAKPFGVSYVRVDEGSTYRTPEVKALHPSWRSYPPCCPLLPSMYPALLCEGTALGPWPLVR